MPTSKLRPEQFEQVQGILNEERRALLARVKARAKSLRRGHDGEAARELIRVAECMVGFGETPPKKV